MKIQKGNTFQTKSLKKQFQLQSMFIIYSFCQHWKNYPTCIINFILWFFNTKYLLVKTWRGCKKYLCILSETWKSTTQMTIVCMIWASLFLLLLREQLKILLPFNFSIIFFHQARKYHLAKSTFLLTVLDPFIEFKWVRMCSKLNEIPFEVLFLCNICKL